MAHGKFDSLISELAGLFEAAAGAMLAVARAFLGGRASYDEALGAIDETRDALASDATGWVEEVLPQVYADGARQSLDSPATPDVDPGSLSTEVHDAMLELYIEELNQQLASATQNISEDAKASLREVAGRRLAASLDNGTNARDEARRMDKELQERGVKFKDKRGREWGPRDYAEMTLRTHTVKVSNQANLMTAAELGSPGVRIRDGGPGDVDEPCRIANGQVWSLAYARAHKLEHPNCRRAFAPLPSTFSGKLDRE